METAKKLSVLFFIFILLLGSFFLAACKTAPAAQEKNPEFLGDLDPIKLESLMAVRLSLGKLKPTEVRLFFVPRTNIIEAYLRDGLTAYALVFKRGEREELAKGIGLYADAYATYSSGDTAAMPNRKPSRENEFNRGTMSVSWGITGLARNNVTEFRTNYNYLEPHKPYFMLTVEAAADQEDSSVESPALNLYFSPSQLEKLLEITDQQTLQTRVDELLKEAFTF